LVNFGGSCNGRYILVYFMLIWYILLPFGTFCGHLVCFIYGLFGIFSPFWYVAPRKIWQPWCHVRANTGVKTMFTLLQRIHRSRVVRITCH
jgi:hypothetical protein